MAVRRAAIAGDPASYGHKLYKYIHCLNSGGKCRKSRQRGSTPAPIEAMEHYLCPNWATAVGGQGGLPGLSPPEAYLCGTTGPRTVPVRSGYEGVGRQNVVLRPGAGVHAATRAGSRSGRFGCFAALVVFARYAPPPVRLISRLAQSVSIFKLSIPLSIGSDGDRRNG